jgi:hypothetical protein
MAQPAKAAQCNRDFRLVNLCFSLEVGVSISTAQPLLPVASPAKGAQFSDLLSRVNCLTKIFFLRCRAESVAATRKAKLPLVAREALRFDT